MIPSKSDAPVILGYLPMEHNPFRHGLNPPTDPQDRIAAALEWSADDPDGIHPGWVERNLKRAILNPKWNELLPLEPVAPPPVDGQLTLFVEAD